MDTLWPWIAVAGAGALHGLNPAAGWGPAVALAMRGDAGSRRMLRALAPIAAGHLLSVGLTAVAIAQGLEHGRTWLALLAVAGLVVIGVRHARRRTTASSARLTGWGLGAWSFVAATAHGAGMMLLPALAPLCLGATVGREITASGSLPLALLVVAVHAAGMLVAGGMAGLLATRALHLAGRWSAAARRRSPSAPDASH
ncbi:hypothetical protein [Mitsuaria sp. GD03876]|uniref:hypothetical protein n=1 Tax=Mitsuaria sp. GD03876 TaxID=2975399 RepID=UPI00244830F7|nr:hypothetical protein [Mitsuaria sp. GD03876]MDH0864448.1 hypothetical protein [Mitsuaria sp. GD03876]